MRFRQHKMWESDDWNGHVLILTLTTVEHRLYVWWKKRGSSYPLPFEYQRRVVLNRPRLRGRNADGSTWIEHHEPVIWPKRRKHLE